MSPRCYVALALLCSTLPVHAQKPLRDPFEHAKAVAVVVTNTPAASSDDWKPELRAVMFDHARSLVDVGGKILALGESTAGYRLIRITERSATFTKDGHMITLQLDKEKSP